MINFEEELKKFKPILEIDNIEEAISSEEIEDIIDILKEIARDKKNRNNL